jgi:hypothetical protein
MLLKLVRHMCGSELRHCGFRWAFFERRKRQKRQARGIFYIAPALCRGLTLRHSSGWLGDAS